MRRRVLFLLLLLAAPLLCGAELIAGAGSRLLLQGSSNVAPWRCRGNTIDAKMDVAVPLSRINSVIDRIEDGDVARLDPSNASFPQPSFNLSIPVASLDCGNSQMERDLHQALRAEAHPQIEFVFQKLVGGVNHDIDRGTYHAKISGVLALAGARKNVVIDVHAQRVSRTQFRLRAKLPLRMTDFRITLPTALFGMIKARNELVVQFDLFLEENRS
ncbi:MAG: YceI family protein [Thermoanaerobaculia bacterium]